MKKQQKLEWLIDYLNKKNGILQNVASESIPPLTNAADLIELMTWSEEEIGVAYSKIQGVLTGKITSGDRSLCPWCINFLCGDCGYGSRHGICTTFPGNNNTYGKITRALSRTITHYVMERKEDFLPKPKRRFEDAKVGDKVWTESRGWGKITEVKTTPYPISVEFEIGPETYTIDGKFLTSDPNPTLHKKAPVDHGPVPHITPNGGDPVYFRLRQIGTGVSLEACNKEGTERRFSGGLITITGGGEFYREPGVSLVINLPTDHSGRIITN